ncbi:hypothetical protein [Paenibacillus puerhi]|uniref:hypothetical protein n=1 Tax=Paenibacillus puerhi TaxID=2692622 RepID=UPI00135CED66|nr:hypothetical protein [Paenibacillus puerhi]
MALLESAGVLSGREEAVWLVIAALAVLGASAERWGVPAYLRFARSHGLTRANYRGEQVPTAGGLLVWAILAAGYAIGRCLLPASDLSAPADFLAAASLVAAAGLLDDLVGVNDIKGLRGHLGEWSRSRTLTTGGVKVLAAAVGAILVLLPQASGSLDALLLVPMQVLLMMLATNSVNLLDLRPGRACKGYLLTVLALAVWAAWEGRGGSQANAMWLAGVWPATIGAGVLLIPDLRRRLMLGDTGANLLGFTAGVALISTSSALFQSLICLLLLLFHLYTAKFSLTALIERNRLLHWVDEFGRSKKGGV